MKKRILAMLLVLAMVLSLSPTFAFAEDGDVKEVADETALRTAIEAGGTVKLTADIALSAGLTIASGTVVTLDLNGKSLSYTDSSSGTSALITNNGTLTIQDTTGEGRLSYSSTTPDANNGYATNTITNAGSLTVLSGTIENTTTGDGGASYAIDTAWTSSGTAVSLTVRGGTICSTKTAIRVCSYSGVAYDVDIYGGEISGIYALQLIQPTAHTLDLDLNIEGGSFVSTSSQFPYSINAYSLNDLGSSTFTIAGGTFANYLYFNATDYGTAKIDITGGTFNDDVYVYGNPSTENVSVSGGTFNGAFGFYTDATDFAGVTGGTFTTENGQYYAKTYMAEGCEMAEDGTVTAPIDVKYNLTLESYMDFSFFIPQADMSKEDGMTVTIQQAGKEAITVTNWETKDGYWRFRYADIAPAEYLTEITLTITDAEGNVIVQDTTTMNYYITLRISRDEDDKTMMEALLAYCAAAKSYYTTA